MTHLVSGDAYPLNVWNNDYIAPGSSGSIGTTQMQERFKHSFPDARLRWNPYQYANRINRYGSNLQNGNELNWLKNFVPKLIDSNWDNRHGFKVKTGWHFQDLRGPDKASQPFTGPTPQYAWKNQVATILNAKTTGNKFLPLPGSFGLEPGDIPRGGLAPVTIAIQSGLNEYVHDKPEYQMKTQDNLDTSKNTVVPPPDAASMAGNQVSKTFANVSELAKQAAEMKDQKERTAVDVSLGVASLGAGPVIQSLVSAINPYMKVEDDKTHQNIWTTMANDTRGNSTPKGPRFTK